MQSGMTRRANSGRYTRPLSLSSVRKGNPLRSPYITPAKGRGRHHRAVSGVLPGELSLLSHNKKSTVNKKSLRYEHGGLM